MRIILKLFEGCGVLLERNCGEGRLISAFIHKCMIEHKRMKAFCTKNRTNGCASSVKGSSLYEISYKYR